MSLLNDSRTRLHSDCITRNSCWYFNYSKGPKLTDFKIYSVLTPYQKSKLKKGGFTVTWRLVDENQKDMLDNPNIIFVLKAARAFQGYCYIAIGITPGS